LADDLVIEHAVVLAQNTLRQQDDSIFRRINLFNVEDGRNLLCYSVLNRTRVLDSHQSR
jgi:hypothetical protein